MRMRLFCPCSASCGVIDSDAGRSVWKSTRRFPGGHNKVLDSLLLTGHEAGAIELGSSMAIAAIESATVEPIGVKNGTTKAENEFDIFRDGGALYGTCARGHVVVINSDVALDASLACRRRLVIDRVAQ